MAFKKSFNKQGSRAHSKSFGISDHGTGRATNRSGDRPAQMFSAVCAKCGKTCEVPFRPSPGRSVFCRDCFRDTGDGASNKTHSNRGSVDTRYSATPKPQPTHEDKRIGEIKWLVEKVENKIDAIIVMLENQNKNQTEKQTGVTAEPGQEKNKTEKEEDKKTAKKKKKA